MRTTLNDADPHDLHWSAMHKVCSLCGAIYDPSLYRGRVHPCSKRVELRQQISSPQWRALRAAQLAAYPYCVDCGAPATDVHHVHKRAQGGALATPELMSLCHSHHSRRTQRGE